MIESGPIPAIHGVVRWRLIDLSQWIYEEFRITVAKQTLSRELRAMGYRKLSARPRHHAQADGAIKIARAKEIGSDKIEIWFQMASVGPRELFWRRNSRNCRNNSFGRGRIPRKRVRELRQQIALGRQGTEAVGIGPYPIRRKCLCQLDSSHRSSVIPFGPRPVFHVRQFRNDICRPETIAAAD
jgi:hypothetical protein